MDGVTMTTTSATQTIGIDLGATNLRVGLVDASGQILSRTMMPLGQERTPATIIAQIAGLVRGLQEKSDGAVSAVGCGVPGIIGDRDGIVFSSPNLPAWKDVPVRDLLAKAVNLPVVVDNDANLYALGEARFGAGKGHRNLVLLTLGSGIGGGIILDGMVFHGDEGFAGEVGHIVLEPDGALCGCGNRGCWERYAASQAFRLFVERMSASERNGFLAAAKATIDGITPELVARLADAGDARAIELWRTFGNYLGIGIATLLNVLGVTTFVIGGGISRSFDRFIGAARESILSHTYAHHEAKLLLAKAALGDDAGIIGAACAAVFVHPRP